MTIYYDDDCGLCTAAMVLLKKQDIAKKFKFMPLQSPAGVAAAGRANEHTRGLNTILLEDGKELLTRASAILRILNGLGGIWKLAAKILALIPLRWLNSLYALVARYRYYIFGKSNTCGVMYG